jgi:uncharacterized membrane protein
MPNLGFTWLDLGAVTWFFVWWAGYARFTEWHGKRVLGTTEKVSAVVQGLPFNRHTSESLWEIKVLLLMAIFVSAFFKFFTHSEHE